VHNGLLTNANRLLTIVQATYEVRGGYCCIVVVVVVTVVTLPLPCPLSPIVTHCHPLSPIVVVIVGDVARCGNVVMCGDMARYCWILF